MEAGHWFVGVQTRAMRVATLEAADGLGLRQMQAASPGTVIKNAGQNEAKSEGSDAYTFNIHRRRTFDDGTCRRLFHHGHIAR